eukprot:946230-Amphidinium_carterae.2
MARQLAREIVAIKQEHAGVIHVQLWQVPFQPFCIEQYTQPSELHVKASALPTFFASSNTHKCPSNPFSHKLSIPTVPRKLGNNPRKP